MESAFSEFNIFVRTTFTDVKSDDLKLKLVSNIYVEGSRVLWTASTGNNSGGNLESFFHRMRLEKEFVFGPPRKHKGWSLDRLKEVEALGVYQIMVEKNVSKGKRIRK